MPSLFREQPSITIITDDRQRAAKFQELASSGRTITTSELLGRAAGEVSRWVVVDFEFESEPPTTTLTADGSYVRTRDYDFRARIKLLEVR